MTRMTILAFTAIALLAGVVALWPDRPVTNASARPIATASFFELHRNAHMENLPVQEFEDQTFVYSKTAQR